MLCRRDLLCGMRGNKIMKRFAALLVSVLVVLNMGLMCVFGETNQAFLETVYQEDAGRLNIICAMPGETGGAENFQVLMGEASLPVLSVSTAEQKELPKTVYCLVDISGSMKGRMEQAKAVLTAISSGLKENDNLVIGKMGNQITDTGLLSGQEEIKAEIDSLQYTNEDTDLYGGLIHGIKYLQQESGVNTYRAIVVLSDGGDDQGDGATWREAYEAVGKADIPVYTAALILSNADYEKAKDLGSFARNSAGGVHFPKSDDSGSKPLDMSGEEMGSEINREIGQTLDVCVDLGEFTNTGKDAYTLSVTFKNDNGKVYEDSREIVARSLKLAEEETEPETMEPETVEPETEPEKKNLPWIIGGSAAALAVVVIVVLVLSSKKKKARAEEERRQEAERLRLEEEKRREEEKRAQELREQERQEAERQEKARREQQLAEQKAREEALKRKKEAFNALPRLAVRLSAIGIPAKFCNIELVKGMEVTVGRNARAKVVLDPQDARLSGIHFVMMWDGRSVYVWDGQSKNGTSVNGVVVNHLGKVAVRPGDSLRAGSYEYRLSWEG